MFLHDLPGVLEDSLCDICDNAEEPIRSEIGFTGTPGARDFHAGIQTCHF